MNTTNPGVAVVTGASSGIGLATAKALQIAGFRVFGTSRRAVAERSDGEARRGDFRTDCGMGRLADRSSRPKSAPFPKSAYSVAFAKIPTKVGILRLSFASRISAPLLTRRG